MSAAVPETNPYSRIKASERSAFDRLSTYLASLDSDGWVEQSYCTDWQVFQVVSHIGSGSRIGALRLQAWVGDGPPITREVMQGVWSVFDSLGPTEMLAAYRGAVDEYLAVEAGVPDEAGARDVDGFAGTRPLWAYQLGRLWELVQHAWDVYVARDRSARLDPGAVSLFAGALQYQFPPLDKDRAAAISASPVVFRLTDSDRMYALDLRGDRPRLSAATDAAEAPLVIEGPDEEVVRFIAGRQYLPGAVSRLRVSAGSPQDLAALRRALR